MKQLKYALLVILLSQLGGLLPARAQHLVGDMKRTGHRVGVAFGARNMLRNSLGNIAAVGADDFLVSGAWESNADNSILYYSDREIPGYSRGLYQSPSSAVPAVNSNGAILRTAPNGKVKWAVYTTDGKVSVQHVVADGLRIYAFLQVQPTQRDAREEEDNVLMRLHAPSGEMVVEKAEIPATQGEDPYVPNCYYYLLELDKDGNVLSLTEPIVSEDNTAGPANTKKYTGLTLQYLSIHGAKRLLLIKQEGKVDFRIKNGSASEVAVHSGAKTQRLILCQGANDIAIHGFTTPSGEALQATDKGVTILGLAQDRENLYIALNSKAQQACIAGHTLAPFFGVACFSHDLKTLRWQMPLPESASFENMVASGDQLFVQGTFGQTIQWGKSTLRARGKDTHENCYWGAVARLSGKPLYANAVYAGWSGRGGIQVDENYVYMPLVYARGYYVDEGVDRIYFSDDNAQSDNVAEDGYMDTGLGVYHRQDGTFAYWLSFVFNCENMVDELLGISISNSHSSLLLGTQVGTTYSSSLSVFTRPYPATHADRYGGYSDIFGFIDLKTIVVPSLALTVNGVAAGRPVEDFLKVYRENEGEEKPLSNGVLLNRDDILYIIPQEVEGYKLKDFKVAGADYVGSNPNPRYRFKWKVKGKVEVTANYEKHTWAPITWPEDHDLHDAKLWIISEVKCQNAGLDYRKASASPPFERILLKRGDKLPVDSDIKLSLRGINPNWRCTNIQADRLDHISWGPLEGTPVVNTPWKNLRLKGAADIEVQFRRNDQFWTTLTYSESGTATAPSGKAYTYTMAVRDQDGKTLRSGEFVLKADRYLYAYFQSAPGVRPTLSAIGADREKTQDKSGSRFQPLGHIAFKTNAPTGKVEIKLDGIEEVCKTRVDLKGTHCTITAYSDSEKQHPIALTGSAFDAPYNTTFYLKVEPDPDFQLPQSLTEGKFDELFTGDNALPGMLVQGDAFTIVGEEATTAIALTASPTNYALTLPTVEQLRITVLKDVAGEWTELSDHMRSTLHKGDRLKISYSYPGSPERVGRFKPIGVDPVPGEEGVYIVQGDVRIEVVIYRKLQVYAPLRGSYTIIYNNLDGEQRVTPTRTTDCYMPKDTEVLIALRYDHETTCLPVLWPYPAVKGKEDTYSLILREDKILKVELEPIYYYLFSAVVGDYGSLRVDYADRLGAPVARTLKAGESFSVRLKQYTKATITATPAPFYALDKLKVGANPNFPNGETLKLVSDTRIEASFTRHIARYKQLKLRGKGAVILKYGSQELELGAPIPEGETLTLQLKPAPGFYLSAFTFTGLKALEGDTYTITGDVSIKVDFSPDNSLITPVARAAAPSYSPLHNPCADYLILHGLARPEQVELYDLQGLCLLRRILAPSQQLDLRALAPGVYILRVNRQSLRIVKR